jgi:dTMP kinase
MFITFEGLDSSGKTTQANLLVDRLRASGKEVVFLREPGGTVVSEKIRGVLLDIQHAEINRIAELFLFSAARTQLVDQVICPALRAGKVVVCDRFYDSTTVYQGYGRGIHLDDVVEINRIATSGTTPDLTLLVDVTPEEIERRRQAAGVADDRMESSGDQFFQRVRKGYRTLAQQEPKRIVVVDGMRSVEIIQKEIWNIVQQRLK